MNIKKELAYAQLDKIERDDEARQQAEAMQMLGLMLQAKQNEEASRRADSGMDMDQQRFEEAKRQFGVTDQRATQQVDTVNRRADEALEYGRDRDKIVDTRYNDTLNREASREAIKADEEMFARNREEKRYQEGKTLLAKNQKLTAFLQSMDVAQRGGLPTDQIMEAFRRTMPEEFPAPPVSTKSGPQGGPMTKEAQDRVLAEARAKETAERFATDERVKEIGVLEYYLGHEAADKRAKKFSDSSMELWDYLLGKDNFIRREEKDLKEKADKYRNSEETPFLPQTWSR